MPNDLFQKFTISCSRIVAVAPYIGLSIAGLALTFAGGIAGLVMWMPGLVAASIVAAKTQDIDQARATYEGVTWGISLIGIALMTAGQGCGTYALRGDNAFTDDGPTPTEGYIYQ